VGHELVVKAVKKLAEQKSADHVIYASNASDAKKNPLLIEKKLQYLNMVFPKTNFVESADNIADVVKHLKESYKNIVIVTSSDKAAAIRRLGVEVIAAGEKDPDSDDTIRSAAAKGLYEEFKKGLPTAVREIDSRRLMNDVRMGTGLEAIKGQINLVKDNLREQYFRGEIFNVGEMVESNGEQFEIVKRGSNHLLVKEASGKLTSKWIQDVKPTEETIKKIKKHPQIKTDVCGQCGKEHTDVCVDDFRNPFDPMFKESFKEWRKNK
jgi:predicted RNA-binding protein with PIN domain